MTASGLLRMTRLDVLIATYKRPEPLARTLRSLARQSLPANVSVRVVVVDNDASESARPVVERLARELGSCLYVCEPIANVANARNRALREACADYVAFIDDDEVADGRWVRTLLEARERYAVAIVFGPVVPVLPVDTARWVTRGRFFERPRFPTGATPGSGATGNVLMELRPVRTTGIMFDPAYGRTGGEDADFFHRLTRTGLRAVWCDEAVVREHVTAERTRVLWLLRRAFIGGMNYTRIFQRGISATHALGSLAVRVVAFVASSLAVPVAALAGIAPAVHFGRKSAGHLGRIVGLYRGRAG